MKIFQKIRKKSKKYATYLKKKRWEIFIFVFIIFQLSFTGQTFASEPSDPLFVSEKNERVAEGFVETYFNTPAVGGENETYIDPFKVSYKKKITVTAYSSTVDQTDSTPCITANGFNLCKHNEENIIAANFLPFGAKIRIPEHFGDKIFIVQDRMNARYRIRADIWMKTRKDAIIFGAKYTEIEVLK